MADVYAGLDPVLVEKVEQLEILAGREGIPIQIKQGVRSAEEQARLYAQGRTTPGAIVTYARPGQSRHQSGRAVDVVPVQDGKPDDASPYWGRLGALGKSLGLVWGGDFTRLKDRYHFELPDAAEAQTRGRRDIPGLEKMSSAFRAKVEQVATRLRMDPQHLLTVMSFETAGTFDPAVRNQAGSGATGLIQFLPQTARQLGTTTEALARMPPERQLDYVEQYLRPYAGRLRTQQDAYMAVLYPSAIGKPAAQVLFTQGTPQYALNKALDKEQKGHVTVGDTMASLGRFLTRQVAPATTEAATPTERPRMTPQQIDQRIRELEALEAQDARRRALEAQETPDRSPGQAPDRRPGQAPPTTAPPPAPAAGGAAPRSPALAPEQAAAVQQPWWQQAARSAVRTASGGILGGLPELAVPAVQRMTDPTQVPQTAANVGEVVGQQIGSALLPGPGTAVGGTLGAVTGLTAGTLATEGRLPTWQEVGREAVWSALPEVGESAVRSLARMIGRGTQGGRLIRLDEAARRARDLPGVFQAQSRQQVGQAFDAVRASGVHLDVGPIRQEVQVLSPGKYADLLAEVQRIDRTNRTGGRYQQLVERLRQGGGVQVAGLPIGDLQQLRSHLRERAEGLTSHEARQLVENFQGAVDDAIDAGIARGRVPTGMTVNDLHEARRQWARVRAAEDLGTLVERSIDVTPDLTMSSLSLKKMANALRRNEGPLAHRINRALDHTPGARAAFQREIEETAQLFQTVELPMAEVFGIWRAPGFAAFRQAISATLASPHGRQIFRQAILDGRGRLSVNALAAAVNAARRESGLDLPEIPGLEEPKPGASTPPTPPGGG